MKLAAPMKRGHTVDELAKRVDQSVVGSVGSIRSSSVIDEMHALHELHREETPIVLDKQLVEAYQIRVSDIGQASELSFEPIQVGCAGPKKGLECDDFVAESVVHFIDHPHSACAQPSHHSK